jgi:hypothetical protein
MGPEVPIGGELLAAKLAAIIHLFQVSPGDPDHYLHHQWGGKPARQFRKVTKTRSAFPHDDALRKLLYLAYRAKAQKWTMPLRNWPYIISQFAIIFSGGWGLT